MPEGQERIGVEVFFDNKEFERGARAYMKSLDELERRTAAYANTVSASTRIAQRTFDDYVGSVQGAISKTIPSVRDLANTTDTATKQTKSTWESFTSSVIGQVARLDAVIGAAGLLAQAFAGPFKAFFEAGRAAETFDIQRQRLIRLVGGIEEYNKALEEMREVTQGLVPDAQLVDSASRMIQMGLADSAKQAAELTRNITLLAQYAGQFPDAGSAFQQFALMMSNASMMRLDAFALSVDTVRARMEELQKTMGMTREEAFRQAVVESMAQRVQELGLNAETSSKRLERINVSLKNLSDQGRQILLPFYRDTVDTLDALASKLVTSLNGMTGSAQELIAKVVGSIRGFCQWLWEHTLVPLIFGLKSVQEAFKGNWEAAEYFAETARNAFLGGTSLAESVAAAIDNIRSAYKAATDVATDSGDKEQEAFKKAEQAAQAYIRLLAEISEKYRTIYADLDRWEAEQMAQSFYRAQDMARAEQRMREDIARQTARRIAAIESSYAQAIANAHNTYRNALEQAARQRSDTLIRIEEEYQRRRRDILRRAAMDEIMAIRARDALALVDARQRRDNELREAQEQRNSQIQETERAYTTQLEAARRAFEQQLAMAEQARAEQLAQLRRSLEEEEEERKIANARREEDELIQAERERGRRLAEIGARIADVYLANQQELAAMRNHYAQLEQELARYYQSVEQYYAAISGLRARMGTFPSGTLPPRPGSRGRQHGGYAFSGIYELGEQGREFVLNAATTHALEQKYGTLTQQTILRLAALDVRHQIQGGVNGQIDVVVRRGIEGLEGRIKAAIDQRIRALLH